MCFNEVYEKVQYCLEYDIFEILQQEKIDIVRDSDLCYGKSARLMSHQNKSIIFLQEGLSDQEERNLILHELGHFYFDSESAYKNSRVEETNANLFMCLYILKNDIWDYNDFQCYLINEGIDKKIAYQINEMIFQNKMAKKYGDSWLIMEA